MEKWSLFYLLLLHITIICSLDSTVGSCFQEQLRLQAQVRRLEHSVKQQQTRIVNLLMERDIQSRDKEEENTVINLGEETNYKGHDGIAHPVPDGKDCAEIYHAGHTQSGFYKMKPLKSPRGFFAYCDMTEGGGWTIFQRRSDGSQNFNRNWTEYEQGFGDFTSGNGEYWLGNKNLHYLTSQENYTLRIDLSDFMDEQRFAQYEKFRVADEQVAEVASLELGIPNTQHKKNSYKMNCGQYSGTAGDSLTGGFHPEVKWWANHQGMKFSTKDRDNDNYEKNCAEEDQAGWWFNRCHTANLNGLYYNGPYSAKTDNGIVWYTWRGWWYSLKSVVMKVRPSNFSPSVA